MDGSIVEMERETLHRLSHPERFLLHVIRAWACCCRARRLPAEPVLRAFAALGIPAGAEALDEAMTRLVLDTRRPLAVHCPREAEMTADEARLLGAAAAARDDRPQACALLAEALPACSAGAVAASLARLGRDLAAAGLPLGAPPDAALRPTLH